MKRLFFLWMVQAVAMTISAQISVVENKQYTFPDSIPPGNYSGITWLGDNQYAVVSDKSADDGFFIFEIITDSLSGDIRSARNLGFRSSGFKGRDNEGIAYNPHTHTLLMTGEQDNRLYEYNLNGMRTLREARLPEVFRHLPANLGLEALSYNPVTHTYWTCNEADTVYMQSFDDSLMPQQTVRYALENAVFDYTKAANYAHGIGTVAALDDGTLLVLERELFVSPSKLGSQVNCVLAHFSPITASKQVLATWKTTLTLFGRSFANYEGMCLGPTLADGSRLLLVVADSQNQYAGVLRDWFKSFKVKY